MRFKTERLQLTLYTSGELYHRAFQFLSAQPQAVADHEYTAECHGTCSQHRVHKSSCSSRDQDDIIDKGPKQVLLDGTQSFSGKRDRFHDTQQIATDQDNRSGSHRYIRPCTNGNPNNIFDTAFPSDCRVVFVAVIYCQNAVICLTGSDTL